MIILAIEQSTVMGSVALVRDGALLAEEPWEHNWFENQHLFGLLPVLLEKTGLAFGDVDVFAAGIGPGSFAGTRMAVAVAQALAMPEGKSVWGISSGEALACDIARETGADAVTVVGDARRNRLWHARFKAAAGLFALRQEQPWSLTETVAAATVFTGGDTVVGPDWERLAAVLTETRPGTVTLIKEPRYPKAATLGLLAAAKIANGEPPGAAVPIYLHPPVFVEPRSTAESGRLAGTD